MKSTNREYVHGYSQRENQRLLDQAQTLTELLHSDTKYPAGANVLEAGCGVGAQTVTLAKNSPNTQFISIDISADSIAEAQKRINSAGYKNVKFQQADIFNLPFADNSFDHIFLCFVLEHLQNPTQALEHLMAKLKPGGTITAIEGDHGSTYFYPDSADAHRTIQCLVDLQKHKGGDALIGRRLFPLLDSTGIADVKVSPRMVYVDSSRPGYVEGFTKNTFIAMVEGVEKEAQSASIIDAADWKKGIQDLYRTTELDGVFCYTFFKAVGYKKN
ncbi:MAG: class I SAM-dependent methyltransferase [Sedimentisphaerales bacterium]